MLPQEGRTLSALGKAIAIRRVELGLSRNDLRDRSGLSYPYVAELEKGVKSPSTRTLDAIARALEIRPHELLARADALAEMETEPMPAAPLTEPAAAPMQTMAAAPRSRPSSESRWFGPARTRAAADTRQPPLTEERVREIVREELRRALGDATK